MGFGVASCLLLVAVVGASHTPDRSAASEPHPSDSVWDRWSGLYLLEDGRLLVVTDLVDQMPDGAHQLMVVEHASGWVRTLYSESPDGGEFEIGAGFFLRAPSEGSLRFVTGASWERDSVLVVDADGDRTSGVRAPVRRREIAFESDGVRIAGELLLPSEDIPGPYPALVFLHGSGPLSRRSPSLAGYQLAAGGVAVVVFDKRGTGASGGSYRPNALVQSASDAVAAIDHARTLPELDPRRIGVHAASEGGFVMPHVVEARPDLAALICRVCPILPWAEALPTYTRLSRLEPAGVPPAEIEEALRYIDAQVEFALRGRGYDELVRRYQAGEGSRWREVLGFDAPSPAPPDAPQWDTFREFLAPDPQAMYQTLEAPIFVVLGEADPRVPAGLHGPRARALLESGAAPSWDVWEVPDANHGLMVVRTGPDGEDLAPVRYADDLHPRLVRWAVEALEGR